VLTITQNSKLCSWFSIYPLTLSWDIWPYYIVFGSETHLLANKSAKVNMFDCRRQSVFISTCLTNNLFAFDYMFQSDTTNTYFFNIKQFYSITVSKAFQKKLWNCHWLCSSYDSLLCWNCHSLARRQRLETVNPGTPIRWTARYDMTLSVRNATTDCWCNCLATYAYVLIHVILHFTI